jgi:hypothetical protein
VTIQIFYGNSFLCNISFKVLSIEFNFIRIKINPPINKSNKAKLKSPHTEAKIIDIKNPPWNQTSCYFEIIIT